MVKGSRCSDNILCHVTAEGKVLCTDGCPLLATIEDGTSREIEAYLHHKDGQRIPVFTGIWKSSVKRADARVYQCKKDGRNRCLVEE